MSIGVSAFAVKAPILIKETEISPAQLDAMVREYQLKKRLPQIALSDEKIILEHEDYVKALESGFGESRTQGERAQFALELALDSNVGFNENLARAERYLNATGFDVGRLKAQFVRYYQKTSIDTDVVAIEAFRGNYQAEHMLGILYLEGKGISQSNLEALKWFQNAKAHGDINADEFIRTVPESVTEFVKAKESPKVSRATFLDLKSRARRGDKTAILPLGLAYLMADGTPADYTKSLFYFRKIQKDSAAALFYIGFQYDQGLGVVKSKQNAMRYYLAAAKRKDKLAAQTLAANYATSNENQLAFVWYLGAWAFGNKSVAGTLAKMKEEGRGTQASFVTALPWYEKAAEFGDTAATEKLANAFFNGVGVAKNIEKALVLYSSLAEKGITAPGVSAGRSLASQSHEPKGYEQAWPLLAVASQRGDASATLSLAEIAEDTNVYKVSWQNVHALRMKSALQGSTDGALLTAWDFQNGIGVEANPRKSIEWYKKSIANDLNNPISEKYRGLAEYEIGKFFEEGVVIERDPAAAKQWYSVSEAKGNLNARLRLESFSG